jgi:hypothetical protein
MTSREFESDDLLLDVAEGRAEPALAARVRAAAAADPALGARLAAWESLAGGLAPARAAAKAGCGRVLRGVREGLETAPDPSAADARGKGFWTRAARAGEALRERLAGAGAGLGLALAGGACLAIVLAGGWRLLAPAAAPKGLDRTEIAVRAAPAAPDAPLEAAGTPPAALGERIESAPEHATVLVEGGRIAAPLRIDRPVRLAAAAPEAGLKTNRQKGEGEKS